MLEVHRKEKHQFKDISKWLYEFMFWKIGEMISANLDYNISQRCVNFGIYSL